MTAPIEDGKATHLVTGNAFREPHRLRPVDGWHSIVAKDSPDRRDPCRIESVSDRNSVFGSMKRSGDPGNDQAIEPYGS